ncbi:MAG: branched-chain amino acid ABC transporter permease [Acidimicrobiales bacterium]
MTTTNDGALADDVSARVRRLRARARRKDLVRLPVTTASRLARRIDLTERTSRVWGGLPRPARWAVLAAMTVVFYILPNFHPPLINTPGSDFASVLFFPVAIYVLAAIGLNVVVGQAGLLDLGYVAFFAIGAYTMALFGTKAHWNFWEVLPLGLLFAAISGVILGAPTLRLRGDYLAIVTLGFGEIIHNTANNLNYIGGPRGISNIPHPPNVNTPIIHFRYGVLDPKPYYWLLLTLIIVVIMAVRRLERSRVGRAWTAIREDEDAAELMGVPTFKFKLWAFAIGASIGGIAGAVFATKVISITPDNFVFQFSILFVAAVVLGGSGNLAGVVVGAAVVGYLPERFRSFQDTRYLWFGAALVVMMIFRPQGLVPARRRQAEMKDVSKPGGSSTGPLGAEVIGEDEFGVDGA